MPKAIPRPDLGGAAMPAPGYAPLLKDHQREAGPVMLRIVRKDEEWEGEKGWTECRACGSLDRQCPEYDSNGTEHRGCEGQGRQLAAVDCVTAWAPRHLKVYKSTPFRRLDHLRVRC